MRKIFYFLIIVLFAVGAFALVSVALLANQARSTVAPVGDLVRDLVVPATPVILPDPVVIVAEIKDLSRLETASYSLEKVIRAEREQEILWGAFGETMIFVAVGEVVAGIDFARMSEADIEVVDPDTVMVHLPEAEIFHTRVDNERSYVADRDTGLLTRADPELETEVRRAAERELQAAAEESDILARANENAEVFMRGFLQELGFENVIFTDNVPPTAEPFQQEAPKGFVVTPVP